MKKMSKMLALMLVLVMVLALFAGCAEEQKPTETPATTGANNDTKAPDTTEAPAPSTTEEPKPAEYVPTAAQMVVGKEYAEDGSGDYQSLYSKFGKEAPSFFARSGNLGWISLRTCACSSTSPASYTTFSIEPVPTATPSPAAPRASDKSIWKFWLRETPIFAEILNGFGFTMVRMTFCFTSGFFSLTRTSTSVTASSSFSAFTPLSKNRAFNTGTARKNTALTTKESTNATGNRKYFARKSIIRLRGMGSGFAL